MRLTRGASRHWQDWNGPLPSRKNNTPQAAARLGTETDSYKREENEYKGERTERV